MSLIGLGLTVLNKIPGQAITGLLTGQLKVVGGVIRWAAGTGKGGQIFMHLLPAGNSLLNMVPGLDFIPGIVANFQLAGISNQIGTLQQMTQLNTYQLINLTRQVTAVSQHIASLSQATQQVLMMATGTAVLSGLSLAVSSVGFMVVNEKLKRIDKKLDEIKRDVQFIRQFLELNERGKLFAALADLLKIETMTVSENRTTIIHNARKTLSEINQKYRELLATSSSVNQAIANEEYYALTALTQARCSAELGEFRLAHQEIEEMHTFWKAQARRIANELLLGEYPERFLASDFAQDVSVSALMSWLDFAYEEEKGIAWIDEIRNKINEPWYGKSSWTKGFWESKGSGLNKGLGVGLADEQKVVIPTLQKLIARNNVFEGYRSQYGFFEDKQLKPSEFQAQVAALPEESIVNGYYLLEPEKVA
jgi:hypothetical protein